MDLNQLYMAAAGGNRRANEELFEHLSVRFRAFARLRIWDVDEAEDVVQNALLAIAEEILQLTQVTSFAAWAYKVLDNRILSYLKKKQRESGRQQTLSDYLRVAMSEHNDSELARRLLDCLGKIGSANRRYARILNLHYQGYSTEEVCEKLDVSCDHAYVILYRARSMLQICLDTGDIDQ